MALPLSRTTIPKLVLIALSFFSTAGGETGSSGFSRPDAGDEWSIFHPNIAPLFVGHEDHPGEAPIDTLTPCGGDTPCPCGGELVESHTMTYDLIGCEGIGLVIGGNDLVLDCNGHAIEGIGQGLGIWIPERSGVTVRNCDIRNFRIGLQGDRADNFRVQNCRFLNNLVTAIWMSRSDGAAVEENYFEGNGSVGIGQRIGAVTTFYRSHEGSITGNQAENNGNVDAYVGGIVLYNSDRNTIARNRLHDTKEDNIWIRLGSGQNRITDNRITGSHMDGIWIRESNDNLVARNEISDINFYGIYVRSGRRNVITGNSVTNAGLLNYGGIGIGGAEYNSTDNIVSGNEVHHSLEGLVIHESAGRNEFLENRLTGNRTAVRIGSGGTPDGNRVVRAAIDGSGHLDIKLRGKNCKTILLDSPFDKDRVDLECIDGECLIDVRWSLDIRVLREDGPPIAEAEITVWDSYGEEVFRESTGANGEIPSREVTEFILNQDGETRFTDHTLRARKEGYGEVVRLLTVDRPLSETVLMAPERSATSIAGKNSGPASLALRLFPNPAKDATRLHYLLPSPAPVTLSIHDVRGRLVARLVEARQDAGTHEIAWNGRDHRERALPAGVYFARLVTPSGSTTRKIIFAGP